MSFIINPYRYVAYDALITAWLARGTTLGYTLPSAAETAKLNTAVVNLRTNGVITGFDVLYFMMFGDSDMATLNVMAPSSYQLTKVSSPTWTSGQGFKGNSTSSYLDTNFNPATNGVNYTLNDASRGAWIYTASSSGDGIDGIASSSNNVFKNNTSNQHRINNGTSNLSTGRDLSGTGYKAINRSSSTAVELYNATTQYTESKTSTSVNNANQLLLRFNVTYADMEISIYYMGRSFSQTEHGYINTEFTTLMS